MTAKRFLARDGLDGNNKTITTVAAPVNDSDAATKGFSKDAANLTTGTLPVARLPALSGGDVSSTTGSAVLTLAVLAGLVSAQYGDSINVPQVTIDTKGRVTAIGEVAIRAASTAQTGVVQLNNTLTSASTTEALTAAQGKAIVDKIGAVNGIASLDASGKVPAAQLPSYVDDVLEYATFAGFPATGETGKIYVDLSSNDFYRWSGSTYIRVSDAVSTSDTATKLATARKIEIGGVGSDLTWYVTFDGSADVIAAATLANTGITAGQYTKITVDAKGRATAGTTLAATDIPNLDWSKITTGKPTTLSGYGVIPEGDYTSGQFTTSTTTANQVIDTFALATFGSARYTVQVKSGVERHTAQLLVTHNGTVASLVEFGSVTSASFLGAFDASVNGANIQLLFTPVNAATTVKFIKELIDA